MKKPLRVLMVEDSEDDALLEIRVLKNGGYDPEYERVETAEAMRTALREKTWDIIVCDYQMPKFNGLAAIALLKETGIDIPMIIVSGTIGEETAVDCMRYGVQDYIMKGNLPRLVPAIERELKEAESRRKRKLAEDETKEAHERCAQMNYEREQVAERLHLILGSIDQGIFCLELDGSCIFVNQAAQGMLGYAPGELMGKELHALIHHSYPDGSPYPAENCPTQITLQIGQVCYRDEEVFWRSNGQAFPIEYSSYPIREEGKILGAVVTFADITKRKQAEMELRISFQNLRKAIGGTIQVISQTVETRDPYTAGHQQRVTDLAQAIGQEMGLEADRVDGLRMAAVIHDLGKICVPAEILSKPTKLSEIQFQLIRTHPQVGHDILNDIDFPWPIAAIILQHHERMDGSGYPRGLRGDDILLEAKILMVADVVEAMASYRPYRPALGIEAALEEIEKNKGILYDPEVVDISIRLFREKGYSFE